MGSLPVKTVDWLYFLANGSQYAVSLTVSMAFLTSGKKALSKLSEVCFFKKLMKTFP